MTLNENRKEAEEAGAYRGTCHFCLVLDMRALAQGLLEPVETTFDARQAFRKHVRLSKIRKALECTTATFIRPEFQSRQP